METEWADTENPLARKQGPSADLERALAGIDGHDAGETVRLLEATVDAKLAGLRRSAWQIDAALPGHPREDGGSATALPAFDAAVRRAFGRLTEAPTNWHQVAVFALTSEDERDAQLRSRATLFFAASWLMVLIQTCCVVGVLTGTYSPSCKSVDQCEQGRYCMLGVRDRCSTCAEITPLPEQWDDQGVLNIGYQDSDGLTPTPEHVRWNLTLVAEVCAAPSARTGTNTGGVLASLTKASVAAWCTRCVTGLSTDTLAVVHVDDSTIATVSNLNLAAIGLFDQLALLLSAFVVACTIVGELKDVYICRLAAVRAGHKISGALRFGLSALNFCRCWVFLPALVYCVPTLVMFKGGDALSVCFNMVRRL